ncbi:DNA-3-methyladenine glycosylase 1-like [Juglans regia]|uniref:DNA-3-methyladenine glycosylase 1-like n=2 Tax=Juglans regia TaxID=51240 RepID=A0A2I4HAD9_JUGRE|nr:DNA-3-methyladenine glycosylase 1-like [Juglans regia]
MKLRGRELRNLTAAGSRTQIPLAKTLTSDQPLSVAMGKQKRSKILSSSSQLRQSQTSPEPTSVDIFENISSSSKIPFRPRKVRKLSSNSRIPPQPPVLDSDSSKPSKANPSQLPILLPITVKSLSFEGEIDAALNHLRKADPLLMIPIDSYQPPAFDSPGPPFLTLAKSILYQQLAANAAKSIYNRFVLLCGGEVEVVPETVLGLNPNQLREVGVSGRKASYLHDLADKFKSGLLSDSSILEMDDESLLTKLTLVKGIGAWSVHMFMIFSLQRPDVLPVGDLGVRKGVQLLYGLKELPRPLDMEQICEKWKPYRSVGSWYMWRCMEAKGAKATSKVAATLTVNATSPE